MRLFNKKKPHNERRQPTRIVQIKVQHANTGSKIRFNELISELLECVCNDKMGSYYLNLDLFKRLSRNLNFCSVDCISDFLMHSD